MSDREEKTGKNDNGKKNKGGKRNKIVAIEMIILVLLIMAAVAIFIQRDKSVKEAAKIHNQKAKKTEQTPQAAQKENEIEEILGIIYCTILCLRYIFHVHRCYAEHLSGSFTITSCNDRCMYIHESSLLEKFVKCVCRQGTNTEYCLECVCSRS